VNRESGIWDCHLHAFPSPGSNVEGQPQQHTLQEYLRTVTVPLSITNLVLVQPSRLGADHSVLLDALRTMAGRARGIAVLPGEDNDQVLDEWNRLGVRGLRYAPRLKQGGDLERLLEAAPTLKRLNWHVQVYSDIDALPDILEKLAGVGVPVVLDHFARLTPDLPRGHPTATAVMEMLRTGAGWIKLSAPYHFSGAGGCFNDLTEIARSLFEANPDRTLWGTDWPHPNVKEVVDERMLLRALDIWGFTQEERDRILCRNPVALYGSV
jgi:D-galactarolactone isomerase